MDKQFVKDYVRQYQNDDLCQKWENNIPLSELEYLEFLQTDSQDIQSFLEYFPFLPAEDISGVVCGVNDGDYSEVYVTEYSRPYSLNSIYHPLSYYLED